MADEEDADAGICEYSQSSAFLIGARALLNELLLIEVPSIKVRKEDECLTLHEGSTQRTTYSQPQAGLYVGILCCTSIILLQYLIEFDTNTDAPAHAHDRPLEIIAHLSP